MFKSPPDLIGGIELSSTEKNRRLQKLIKIVSSEGYQFHQGGGRYRENDSGMKLASHDINTQTTNLRFIPNIIDRIVALGQNKTK